MDCSVSTSDGPCSPEIKRSGLRRSGLRPKPLQTETVRPACGTGAPARMLDRLDPQATASCAGCPYRYEWRQRTLAFGWSYPMIRVAIIEDIGNPVGTPFPYRWRDSRLPGDERDHRWRTPSVP